MIFKLLILVIFGDFGDFDDSAHFGIYGELNVMLF